MNDQVDEVKQKTDIVALISNYVELKKAGSKYKGLCPFHAEKTPSFIVSPEIQIFKCFGCQKSGDVFTFLEEYEGMEFYESLKFLAERAGVNLRPIKGVEKSSKEKIYEINALLTKFYEYCLLKHPSGKNALSYLNRERGLTIDTIKKFRLGFSPNEALALKKFVIDRNKVSYKDLETTGVTYSGERGTFDRFRGRVIFPLFNQRGEVAGFAGRILPNSTNKDLAKYINTPETLVYKKSRILYGLNDTKADIKKAGAVVVVEGEFDLINSWQVGIRNIVAIKGSALTEEQVKLLSRYAKKMVLALDEDFAGNEASMRGIRIAEKEGFEIKVARLTKFKDPADAALGNPEELKIAISAAVDVWDFVINFIFSKYKGEGGNTKAKISKEVTPVLVSIEDKIVQAHYINLVAEKLNVPVDAVSDQIYKINNNTPSAIISGTSVEDEIKTRREMLEENLLAVIFRLSPSLLDRKNISGLFNGAFSKKILSEYQKIDSKEKFDLHDFAERLPRELKSGFTDLILKEIQGLESADESRLDDELKLIIRNIQVYDIKNELAETGEMIKKLEEIGDKSNLDKAQEKFSKLTVELYELEAKKLKGIMLR